MQNPFNQTEAVVDVTNSELYCEQCAFVTDAGKYYPAAKRLVFVCPNGHVNTVKELELD